MLRGLNLRVDSGVQISHREEFQGSISFIVNEFSSGSLHNSKSQYFTQYSHNPATCYLDLQAILRHI